MRQPEKTVKLYNDGENNYTVRADGSRGSDGDKNIKTPTLNNTRTYTSVLSEY